MWGAPAGRWPAWRRWKRKSARRVTSRPVPRHLLFRQPPLAARRRETGAAAWGIDHEKADPEDRPDPGDRAQPDRHRDESRRRRQCPAADEFQLLPVPHALLPASGLLLSLHPPTSSGGLAPCWPAACSG